MRANLLLALAALLLGFDVACSTQQPTAPMPTLPTPLQTTDLIIEGVPKLPKIGDTAQLTAKIVLASDEHKLINPKWTSSNTEAATISASGLLTIVGIGRADITVEARGKSASASLWMTTTISGMVHETVPTETVIVPDASVTIEGCINCAASTDQTGHFTVRGVDSTRFTLLARKAGYDDRRIDVQFAPAQQPPTADISLTPEAVRVHSQFTGNLCITSFDPFDFRYSLWPPYNSYSVCAPGHFPYPTEMNHAFAMHRPGTATVTVTYTYAGDYYWNYLSFEMRCADQVIVERRIKNLGNNWPDNTGPFQVEMPQACAYQVRLFDFKPDVKGGDWTTYHVDIDHFK